MPETHWDAHLVGTPAILVSSLTHHTPFRSTADNSNPPDLKILISHPLTTHEHVSLITTIFSDNDRPEVDRNLSRDDYQTVIDIMDEVSLCTFPSPRNGQVDSHLNLRLLLVRLWIVFHHRYAGDVCVFYAGFVVTKPCSLQHFQFRFLTT